MASPFNRAETLEAAAQLWIELGLPDFRVEGHLDGRYREFTVSEVLRTAAERLRAGAGMSQEPGFDVAA